MKKLFITLILATVCFGAFAQNTFPSSGNVGIGTTSPGYLLDVNGVIHGNHEVLADGGLRVGSSVGDDVNGSPWYVLGISNLIFPGALANAVQLAGFWGLNIQTQYGRMVMLLNGNVGIGTTNPDQLFTVNGTIHAKQVNIDLSVPAPDFVFNRTYKLKTLSEVNRYILVNKHLPEIPSATAMAKDGVNVAELNMKLLQKVEELTLYLISKDKQINAEKGINDKQQKQIDGQQQVNEALSDQLKSQQEQLDVLKKQLKFLIKQS